MKTGPTERSRPGPDNEYSMAVESVSMTEAAASEPFLLM